MEQGVIRESARTARTTRENRENMRTRGGGKEEWQEGAR
jgi:hypothetical protein